MSAIFVIKTLSLLTFYRKANSKQKIHLSMFFFFIHVFLVEKVFQVQALQTLNETWITIPLFCGGFRSSKAGMSYSVIMSLVSFPLKQNSVSKLLLKLINNSKR